MAARSGFATGVRMYAAAAGAAAPKKLYGVNGRYATALYQAAAKAGNQKAVEGEVSQVRDWASKDQRINSFLNDPFMPKAAKLDGMNALCTKAGFSPTTKAFFGVLVENNRLQYAVGISDSFSELMRAERGEVEVMVTTAKAMSQQEFQDVEKALKAKYLPSGSQVSIASKVDASMLGGIRVEIGDNQFLDMSVSTRIAEYSRLLSGGPN
jgi:F-type H+-transporting ATPase subunit O